MEIMDVNTWIDIKKGKRVIQFLTQPKHTTQYKRNQHHHQVNYTFIHMNISKVMQANRATDQQINKTHPH